VLRLTDSSLQLCGAIVVSLLPQKLSHREVEHSSGHTGSEKQSHHPGPLIWSQNLHPISCPQQVHIALSGDADTTVARNFQAGFYTCSHSKEHSWKRNPNSYFGPLFLTYSLFCQLALPCAPLLLSPFFAVQAPTQLLHNQLCYQVLLLILPETHNLP
jgi:hypothetical protein